MFHHGRAIVCVSRLGDDGVVHDGEGDVVDEVVGYFLTPQRVSIKMCQSQRGGVDKPSWPDFSDLR